MVNKSDVSEKCHLKKYDFDKKPFKHLCSGSMLSFLYFSIEATQPFSSNNQS